jgi:hypothetical protein
MVFVRKAAMAVFVLVLVAQFADAGPFRNRRGGGQASAVPFRSLAARVIASDGHEQPASTVVIEGEPGDSCDDALDLVNKDRLAWGMKPFVRDGLLVKAAAACVKFRAKHGIWSHSNDFYFFPEGVEPTAKATGAEGMDPHWRSGAGWGTCCTDDPNFTHAGAAWAIGADGHLYMSLFVR